MTSAGQCIKNLAWDLLVFVEIVLYWPFAILVMLPLRRLDLKYGTNLFAKLDRMTRAIADL